MYMFLRTQSLLLLFTVTHSPSSHYKHKPHTQVHNTTQHNTTMEENKPQIAIIPSPGMGHLIPLVQFSKLIFSHFPFTIHLIIPTTAQPGPAQTTLLNSLPSSITHTFLPTARVDPAHEPPIKSYTLTLSHALPHVRATLASRAPVAALIVDLFGTIFIDLAREMGIPPYVYYTTNAMCLSFLSNLPSLDKTVLCEYKDMHEPLVLPGCTPVHGKHFPDPVQDRKSEAYSIILGLASKYILAEGIFINTFVDLELETIQALRSEEMKFPPVYPIGPLIQSDQKTSGSDCLSWLDNQPCRSVLYVSFGSRGTLSTQQTKELAMGLENSGQRFLWVIRSPNDETSTGSFFSEDDALGFLPPGFADRVKDRGLLVPSWAPQIEVLSHLSIGGFLTHCGWNSTLESIIHGVALIAWPLYAEQKMNAVLLSEGLKVALRPKVNENGVVEGDEIAKVVKELMEGEEGKSIASRMKELSDKAKRATSDDGKSTKLFREVAAKWSTPKN